MGDWEEILPDKLEELREAFHEFIESGGDQEECVRLLNESLGYMGIMSYVTESPRTNQIVLPPSNALMRMYNMRNRAAPVVSPGYTTPRRGPPTVAQRYRTPSGLGTPFEAPPLKRKRPNNNTRIQRFSNILNNSSQRRRKSRKNTRNK